MTLLLLILLVSLGKGKLMARGMDFRKPRLREYMASSSLCTCQYPPEVLHCSRSRLSVSLNFIKNDVFLFVKIRWKLQLVGFSYDKKSANVVIWKDSTSQVREINNNKELTILRLQNVSRKES